MRGKPLTFSKAVAITKLLTETDLPIKVIAIRLGVSKSSVVDLNRKENVRGYRGYRTQWKIGGQMHENAW